MSDEFFLQPDHDFGSLHHLDQVTKIIAQQFKSGVNPGALRSCWNGGC
jgi:hypothetical protein